MAWKLHNYISETLYTDEGGFIKGATIKVIRSVDKVVNSGGYGGSDSYSANKQWGEDMKVALLDYIVDFVNEFKSVKL